MVTGAGSGIGRESVKLLLQNGAKVVGIDFNKAELEKLQQEYDCDIILGDASDQSDVKSYTKAIGAKHGHVDVLVNNAANATATSDILTCSSEQFQDLQNISIMNVFWNSKYFAPFMPSGASIINISSNYDVYHQHAMFGLTKQIGADLSAKKGIRCNSVHPDDDLKLQKSSDSDSTYSEESILLFLASDESMDCNQKSFVAPWTLPVPEKEEKQESELKSKPQSKAESKPTYSKGLSGVIAGETTIATVGKAGLGLVRSSLCCHCFPHHLVSEPFTWIMSLVVNHVTLRCTMDTPSMISPNTVSLRRWLTFSLEVNSRIRNNSQNISQRSMECLRFQLQSNKFWN